MLPGWPTGVRPVRPNFNAPIPACPTQHGSLDRLKQECSFMSSQSQDLADTTRQQFEADLSIMDSILSVALIVCELPMLRDTMAALKSLILSSQKALKIERCLSRINLMIGRQPWHCQSQKISTELAKVPQERTASRVGVSPRSNRAVNSFRMGDA
jgi:hypothetical protein